MSKMKVGKKAFQSVSQYFSELLGRPVGLNESATKVQAEAINKQKMKNKNKDKFLVGGQAKIDKNKNNRIDAEDFKILREENNMKKGGVTSAIRKIRGIGMAKGGFKKKTPIY